MRPHLLVVGAGISRDPGPAGRGRRLSGEHSGGGGRPIGEEIGMPSPPQGPPVARSDGIWTGEGKSKRSQEDPSKALTAKIYNRARRAHV